MGKITFILGGARSGKSRYAIKLAKAEKAKKAAFIATCLPLDSEMKKRVTVHKKKRPAHWQTFEGVECVSSLLKKICPKFEVILIDCLTLLVSSLLLKNLKEDVIEDEVNKIISVLKKNKVKSIIVSNEVGLGIVPQNGLARNFRDIVGRINQILSEKSDEVFFLVSGIPWKIK